MPRGGVRPPCTVNGCSNDHVAGGFCNLHYRRWKKWGDPLFIKPPAATVCTIPGCQDPPVGRGWCRKHYYRWERNGDPVQTKILPPGTALNWLRNELQHGDRSICWQWPFNYGGSGYGVVTYNGHSMSAHAVALILDGNPRPAPPNHHALHRCDNPPCVNPSHCWWGSNEENRADSMQKGRTPRGSRHHSAKLTDEQVRAIRIDARTYRAIAAEYGISPPAICRIKSGKQWGHVS